MLAPRRALLGVLLLTAACTSAPQAVAPSTSTPASFNPDPSPGSGEVSFELAVIGDFGSGDAREDAMAARLRTHVTRYGTWAILTTGDNIYPSALPKYFDRAWTRPYGWVSERGTRVIASLGNHDVAGDVNAVMELLDMPSRYHSTLVADAEIFVLDSNRPDLPGQATWLTRALRGSDARWKIVVFHHPPYSCALHGNTASVVANWVPIFEANGVDLVLSGHDHNYQRFAPKKGVTYIVTGGGGSQLYGFLPCAKGNPEPVAMNAMDLHFLSLAGLPNGLRVRAITDEGATFDEVTLPASD